MRSVALEEQLIADLLLGPGIAKLIMEYLELEGIYKDHRVKLRAPHRTA